MGVPPRNYTLLVNAPRRVAFTMKFAKDRGSAKATFTNAAALLDKASIKAAKAAAAKAARAKLKAKIAAQKKAAAMAMTTTAVATASPSTAAPTAVPSPDTGSTSTTSKK